MNEIINKEIEMRAVRITANGG